MWSGVWRRSVARLLVSKTVDTTQISKRSARPLQTFFRETGTGAVKKSSNNSVASPLPASSHFAARKCVVTLKKRFSSQQWLCESNNKGKSERYAMDSKDNNKEEGRGAEAADLIISHEEKDVFLCGDEGQKGKVVEGLVARDQSEGIVLTMDACFKSFDKDEDLSLNINEFTALLKALFRNEKGRPYNIDDHMCNEIFNIFNKSGDGSLSKEEFVYCWNNWIKKIVRPVSALIVVDVQNDFISGTLAISNCPAKQNGEEVVPPINKLTETVPFDAFYYSLDWHPQDHISFIENVSKRKIDESSPISDPEKVELCDMVIFEGPPKTEQIMWPGHCVQTSWGAELHKDLKVHPQGEIIHKGTNPDVDSYSAFFDNQKLGHTQLEELLTNRGVTDVYVCGIAADVCVASTAFHALELGFRTVYLENCSRGIKAEDIKKTLDRVRNENGVVINSSEAKAMVQGRDRRVELGYALAVECRKKIGLYPPKNKNSRFNPVPQGMGGGATSGSSTDGGGD